MTAGTSMMVPMPYGLSMHDEARFESLAKDMDGILIFAGLFSAVLTSFLVQSLQNLQVNPVEKSVYYQNQSAYYQQQSVAILAQISQQIASIALRPEVSLPSVVRHISTPTTVQQFSIPSTSPPAYSAFKPLVRFQQFFFQGSRGMRKLAKQVPRLIRVSLFLFFLGLCDSMINTNTTVGVTAIVPISLCGICYLYSITTHIKDLQSPYKTPISRPIFFLIKTYQQLFGNPKLRTLKKFEAYREEFVMDEKERKKRDVRAIRWLVDNTTVNAKMEPLVLAIPSTFNTE
ncbi:hypothetical protein V8E53_005490 [Lactarius tabidus]